MAYKLKKKLSKKCNYGTKRNTKNIKFIVIHFTANDGDTDEANANYFNSRNVGASAHYFVDDDSVTQSVPDNYVAWAVGGSKYSNCAKTGGGKYYSKCTNANSLSIELCDSKKDGKIYPTDKTIANALDFTKKMMKKYNVSASNVIRHFDVNGKSCPGYWAGTTAKNKLWKTAFHDKLTDKKTTSTTATTTAKKDKSYKVKVTADTLNVRAGAGTKYKVTKTVEKNQIFTIVAESNGWGKLKSGAGWVSLSYVKKC